MLLHLRFHGHHSMKPCLLALLLLLYSPSFTAHEGHSSQAGPHCDATSHPIRVVFPFVPGTITVDGKSGDWDSVEGKDLVLLQAIHPDPQQPFQLGTGGMTIKGAHDGESLFILVKVPAPYAFNGSDHHLSASTALMFAVGDDATFYNMGGCPNAPGQCNPENCRGHEVDFIHFEIDSAIPGRVYGENIEDQILGTGIDRYGHLTDGYCWNPHCRFPDGAATAAIPKIPGAQNDWQGAWSHSSISNDYGFLSADSPFGLQGDNGEFIFEFRRLLRTKDVSQQDVQLSINGEFRFSAAFWYPASGVPWSPSQHYVPSCDWLIAELWPAPTPANGWASTSFEEGISNFTTAAISIVSLLVSLAAISISIIAGWWVRGNSRQFSALEMS